MKFTHTRLLVDDYAECFRFYRDVLGFEPTFGDEHSAYADFDTGDVTLALFDRGEMDAEVTLLDAGENAMLVFGVADVDAACERLRDELVAPPTDHPEWGVRTAHLRDPDGTLIEINEPLE